MLKFKNTEFAKGLKISFADFKKVFKDQFTRDEMEQAYNVATKENGNIKSATKKSSNINSKKS